MKRFLLVIVLMLSACQSSETLEDSPTDTENGLQELFFNAFHSPECTNPCWLGIEVGETVQATVIGILEEHEIDYGVPGVIHLYSVPEGSVPGAQASEVTPPAQSSDLFGDINVGQQSDDIVQSIDFSLDLCVSTLIEIYGVPGVRFTQDKIPTTLTYVKQQLLFTVNADTLRIDWVIMHTEENMPHLSELEDWTLYADIFSDECTDAFSALLR